MKPSMYGNDFNVASGEMLRPMNDEDKSEKRVGSM